MTKARKNTWWITAAALLAIVPPILLYLSMQKYFIKGIADGAVKG